MSGIPPIILTITQLMTGIRATLEQAFPDVWVEGEISNLRMPVSGHVYFSLKDQASQIRAVAFRRVAASLPFTLEDGLMVLVKGRVSVYEPRGDAQILIESLEPKGVGALQIAFEQLKARLHQEGMFDPARKRALPFFPRHVGVITSRTGAALHDIVTVVQRRCPLIGIRLFPVAVQGPGAARQIADAVRLANQQNDLDVLIVGRGGGAWEDLWSFNEEVVVRAIADSRLPVVSAVGHEIDVTLSDLAADYRAPTPSAAAEAISPVLVDLQDRVRTQHRRLAQTMRRMLVSHGKQVDLVCRALPDLADIVQRQMQRVDEFRSRLGRSLRAMIAQTRPTLLAVSAGLVSVGPGLSWQRASLLVPQLRQRLSRAMPWAITHKKHQLRTAASTLHTLSPLAILSRGYSMIETSPGGVIVHDAHAVEVGDRIRVRLAKGRLSCLIEDMDRVSSILTSREHGV